MSNYMNILKLFVFTTIILLSTKGSAQRIDTIPYASSYVIVHYNAIGQIRFYEYSYFMKDSTWKRTYYSKGQIKNKTINGVKALDTLYLANAFLEKTESYYPNGNIKSIWFNKRKNKSERFQTWSMDSISVTYYQNGQIDESLFWVNNNIIGEAKYYHENGQIAYIVNYKEGRLNNIVSYFDKNGNELSFGTFKNGNGDWNKYDDKGNIIKIEVYKNGKLKKLKKIPITRNKLH